MISENETTSKLILMIKMKENETFKEMKMVRRIGSITESWI